MNAQPREPELTPAAPPKSASVDLVILRILPNAVRCREIGGGVVAYRRKAGALVPGQRLTVHPERRWQWRKTAMLAGELLHLDFSLRGLQQAGFDRTRHVQGWLASPGDADPRLRLGILAHEEGDWIRARRLLLDVVEQEPGNLLAQATLGSIHRPLGYHAIALAHFTAAIRLGLGALVHEAALPLDPRGETERALLRSLVSRAALLVESGRDDAAAADLTRALAWEPTDSQGAASPLKQLQARATESRASPGAP